MASDLIVELDSKNFDEKVLRAEGLTLVDFWAPWCGPCRMVGPILEQIAQEMQGQVRIVKVNVDDSPDLAKRYGIMSIPTMMLFKGGEALFTEVGVRPKPAIVADIKKHMA